jgi:cap2 methyltransferase
MWPADVILCADLQEPGLQILKAELNSVKSKLDCYNLNDWHKHTRAMNKAGEILWRLRKELEPEFLTQVLYYSVFIFSVWCTSAALVV